MGALQQEPIALSVGEMLQNPARSLLSVGIDSIMPNRIINQVGNIRMEQHLAIAYVGMNIAIPHRIVRLVEMHTALQHKTGLSVGIGRQ